MNPFTKALAAGLRSRRFKTFIERWDALEALVVRVYRAGAATSEDERAFAGLKHWLTRHYSEWQAALEVYWRTTLRAGQPCMDDPFRHLLSAAHASDFCGSWTHMQALPAAREALNRLILEESASQ
jgi:hypothetical protein